MWRIALLLIPVLVLGCSLESAPNAAGSLEKATSDPDVNYVIKIADDSPPTSDMKVQRGSTLTIDNQCAGPITYQLVSVSGEQLLGPKMLRSGTRATEDTPPSNSILDVTTPSQPVKVTIKVSSTGK